MEWKEIKVLSERHCVEAIAGAFHSLGSGGVVIEDPRTAPPACGSEQVPTEYPGSREQDWMIVKAYFPGDRQVLDQVRTRLEQVEQDFSVHCEMFIKEVREEDWAESWKQYFHAFKVGERLVIKPSWEDYQAEPGEIVIEIDPGMAFGTGIHASTRFCLLFLDEFLQGGESLIDAGCGSGILSIAAARLGAARVWGMDIDPVAVRTAAENVRLNQVDDIVGVRQGDIAAELSGFQADVVVANIIAEVVAVLIPEAAAALSSGGWFFGSGIIEEQWPLVQNRLVDCGFAVEKLLREAEWVGVAARKL